MRLGQSQLSDQELLAILLGSGGQGRDVMSLASMLTALTDRKNLDLSVEDICAVPGIGAAKACALLAALEFARRRITGDGVKIREPSDVIPLVTHLADRKQETFIAISLNGAHEVLATRVVTIGLANICQIHPREVFADALTDRACAVIVAHNHPSGDPTPSAEDIKATQRLQEAALVLGLKLLDHIIFSRRGYRSLKEDGKM